MNPLSVCPSLLSEGHTSYSPAALRMLFDGAKISHILQCASPSGKDADRLEAIHNIGRLSLSGAQPKFGMVLDSGKTLRYARDGESSFYIMKPQPSGYQIMNREFCAANENLTMQLASQIYGIETAANALAFFEDGEMAYITRRFDRQGNRKFALEDFASLMGLTRQNGGSDYKYNNGSYEECAEIIRRYVKSSAIDVLKFFRIVVFNFITLNDDAHLKNFSLLNTGKEYRLAPAYDLINTSLQIYEPRIFALDKGLFREGMQFSDTRSISRADFIEFGRRIGLPLQFVEKEIAHFSAPNQAADALIERSFLSPEMKKSYLSAFHFRQFMISR